MENPNQRFKKKEVAETSGFYVYDIEEQSNNIIEKEKLKALNTAQLQEKIQQQGEWNSDLIRRIIAFMIDLALSSIYLLSLFSLVILIFSIYSFTTFFVTLDLFPKIFLLKWIYIPGYILWVKIPIVTDFFTIFVTKALVITIQILVISLFNALFESTKHKATPGKILMNLVVTHTDLTPLDFATAYRRNMQKFLLFPVIGLALNPRITLHNRWTQSIVKHKNNLHSLSKF